MNRTAIEWTDFTSNPIKFRAPDGRVVWACEKLSPGCKNCYAAALAERYTDRRAGDWNAETMRTLTPFLDEQELRRMLTYKPASGKRVFVGDMTDVVGDWVQRWMLAQLIATMALRYDVTWQLLTKRAERLRALMTDESFRAEIAEWVEMLAEGDDGCDPLARTTDDLRANAPDVLGDDWPIKNIWLGVSAEDQQRADERIPQLLETPAAVRFVSAEPLLGPIDLERVPLPGAAEQWYGLTGVTQPIAEKDTEPDDWKYWTRRSSKLHWLIVGGESGAGARPTWTPHVRSIVQQCAAAGVPVFVKQLGSDTRDRNDAGFTGDFDGSGTCWPEQHAIDDRIEHDLDGTRDGYQGAPVRIRLRDRKGGDPSEWPEDVRVREFPREAVPA